jgi:hypothetical protein
VNTLRGVKIYIYLCQLFDLSLKAGSLWAGNEGIERHGVKASSASCASQNKRKRQGKGAHTKKILIETLALLEVVVPGRIPRIPRPIGFC